MSNPDIVTFIGQCWARGDIDAIADRIESAESQPATLTPRQCAPNGLACFVAGWESAREAAADKSESFFIARPTSDVESGVRGASIKIASAIRSLTPPADCGDCNPLAPDDDTICQCDCDCRNTATETRRGLRLCSLCAVMSDHLTDYEIEIINQH